MKERWRKNIKFILMLSILWMMYSYFYQPLDPKPLIFCAAAGVLLGELLVLLKKQYDKQEE